MKRSKIWFASILIASALLLSVVRNSVNASPIPSTRIEHSGEQSVRRGYQKNATQNQAQTRHNETIIKSAAAPKIEQKTNASDSSTQKQRLDVWNVSDKIAAIAAGAAFLQFLALLATIRIMQKSAQRQLRAYVSGDPEFVVAFDESTPTSIRYAIRNVGQTPALAMRQSAEIVLCPFPLPTGYQFSPILSEPSPPIVLFPNVPVIGVKESRLFSTAEIADIRNRIVKIYIIGRIEYQDVFRKRHSTTFCAGIDADNDTLIKLTSYYRPPDLKISFFRAPIGNDAD
jgi:hypothetical protein